MKRTLILTLSVLAAALIACTASYFILNATVDRAGQLQSLAVLDVQEGRPLRAAERMVALAEYWRDRAPLLETLASHDALHEVTTAIAEARICLECDDHDDFLRTMSLVGAGLEHLRDEASIRWSNLY